MSWSKISKKDFQTKTKRVEFWELLRVSQRRFFDLRRDRVRERCLFPTRKSRRPKHDLKLLVKKSEEDYIDFQEAGPRQVFKEAFP